MDKKLEARIARLERLMNTSSRKQVTNELMMGSSQQVKFYKSEILPQIEDFKEYFKNIPNNMLKAAKMLGKGETGDDLDTVVEEAKDDIRYLKEALEHIEDLFNELVG